MPVNEVFQTIQGEARFTGTPAVFIRLQGCAVGCGWCDTKHTWELSQENRVLPADVLGKFLDGPGAIESPAWAMFHVEQLIEHVAEHKGVRHVVITGGEPANYDLKPLTEALDIRGYQVQLETSGTKEPRVHPRTWVTVSPKIDMPGKLRVIPEVIYSADEIKFPVGKEKDIQVLLDDVIPFANHKAEIWLQPLSMSKKATAVCINAAKEHGWRVSLQTHKFLGLR